MIDIHAHILPHMDDGSSSWEESIKMAIYAAKDGITDMVCTPHYVSFKYDNTPDKIKKAVGIFRKLLKKKKIPLRVYPGSEVHINPSLATSIDPEAIQTINDSSYILLELPLHFVPPNLNDILWNLKSLGYTPIIAHPERYIAVLKHPDLVEDWVTMGALIQVTAASIIGAFGKKVRDISRMLLDHNLVHVIATDTHGMGNRSPKLSHVYTLIAKEYGTSFAEGLFLQTPRKIIENLHYEEADDFISLKRPPSLLSRVKRFIPFLQKRNS